MDQLILNIIVINITPTKIFDPVITIHTNTIAYIFKNF